MRDDVGIFGGRSYHGCGPSMGNKTVLWEVDNCERPGIQTHNKKRIKSRLSTHANCAPSPPHPKCESSQDCQQKSSGKVRRAPAPSLLSVSVRITPQDSRRLRCIFQGCIMHLKDAFSTSVAVSSEYSRLTDNLLSLPRKQYFHQQRTK